MISCPLTEHLVENLAQAHSQVLQAVVASHLHFLPTVANDRVLEIFEGEKQALSIGK